MHLFASVANKRRTAKLNPLDATLTQNRGYPLQAKCLSLSSRLPIQAPAGETSYRAQNLSLRGNAMALFGDGDRGELEKKAKAEGRLPPGQSLTLKWPVLHYGSVPHFDAAKWDFKISGLVEEPVRLASEKFRALPHTEVTSDFHCVTRWSRLGNPWTRALFTELLKLVKKKPAAKFA